MPQNARFVAKIPAHLYARASAAWTTDATVRREMPLFMQYLDSSHAAKSLAPLLALQPLQQMAVFSRVTTGASLTIGSHEGLPRLGPETAANETPQ